MPVHAASVPRALPWRRGVAMQPVLRLSRVKRKKFSGLPKTGSTKPPAVRGAYR